MRPQPKAARPAPVQNATSQQLVIPATWILSEVSPRFWAFWDQHVDSLLGKVWRPLVWNGTFLSLVCQAACLVMFPTSSPKAHKKKAPEFLPLWCVRCYAGPQKSKHRQSQKCSAQAYRKPVKGLGCAAASTVGQSRGSGERCQYKHV